MKSWNFLIFVTGALLNLKGGAVHCYYESKRRLFNDSQPQRREKATQVKRTSLKRKLQQRLFQRRKKMLKKDRERSFWDAIDYQYMTEEGEGEDYTVIRHLHPWRSESLNKLVKKLDKRCEKRDKLSNCKRKRRVTPSDSSSAVPRGAQAWTIKE